MEYAAKLFVPAISPKVYSCQKLDEEGAVSVQKFSLSSFWKLAEFSGKKLFYILSFYSNFVFLGIVENRIN